MRHIEIEGMRLSRIGLGTWQFGTREWGYGDGYARVTAPELVRRAAELGITMLDTAEGYGRRAPSGSSGRPSCRCQPSSVRR